MQYPLTQPGVDLSGGKFTDGNPVLSIPASRDRAADMNLVYDELIALVVAAGLTPSEASSTQVRDAVLALIKGGDYKDSVRVASTAAINLAAPGANIDGVAMVAGDRFLEKDNATASARGIYIWNGAAAAATRATDADTGAEFNSGAIIPVQEGAVNANKNWQLTTDGTVIIGTTGLDFIDMKYIGAGYMLVQDQKASGTAGGASVAGLQTRTLNTVVKNTIAGASLSGNQITLPAGNYRINARAPVLFAQHRSQLFNVTDNVVHTYGSNANGLNSGTATSIGNDPAQTDSFVNAYVEINATKVFTLRTYCSEANATNGLGAFSVEATGNEIYSSIEIIKD